MLEIDEEIIEPKTTTAQISPTYCEGYFAFAKGECTGNNWQSLAAWPNTSSLGTFEQFKEAARKQILTWSSSGDYTQPVTIKFSKVVLSE